MTDINKVLEEASADAEQNRGDPPRTVRAQRRAGAASPAVLSVRLTQEQLQQLSDRAARAGKPTSALARDILLAALGESDDDQLSAKIEQVLRRTLSPDVLAA